MPLSSNIEAYADERLIWQTALVDGGTVVKCGTRSQAVVRLQRLHMFRTLDRRASFDGKYTVFDDFTVKHPGKADILVIEKRAGLGELVLSTPSGQPASLDEARQQILSDANDKADAYLRTRQIDTRRIDTSQIDPDAPLDLE